LSFPVEIQAYTSPYGQRINPVTGQSQFHRGLDIAAPRGSYIRNWWSGQLVSLSDNTACGTMLVIASGSWEHIYCHLEGEVGSDSEGTYFYDSGANIMIRQNQIVPGGARIARVGMSGRTTGPHLHWGLKFNGNYIDPAIVLREMYKNQ
ncbi:MAG: M23 family metallopeptidase, partial [Synechococcaceae cyanobacterium RL_1_2]|nr:M23 family metallopeptidase [Synechococcaceae cyanobacterium RL_1_2]